MWHEFHWISTTFFWTGFCKQCSNCKQTSIDVYILSPIVIKFGGIEIILFVKRGQLRPWAQPAFARKTDGIFYEQNGLLHGTLNAVECRQLMSDKQYSSFIRFPSGNIPSVLLSICSGFTFHTIEIQQMYLIGNNHLKKIEKWHFQINYYQNAFSRSWKWEPK